MFPNSVNVQKKFQFNGYLLETFNQLHYAPFVLPCIYGFVQIKTFLAESGLKYDYALISKKDVRRPGKRFLVRGLDPKGNAANFVESEHLVVVHDSGTTLRVGSYL